MYRKVRGKIWFGNTEIIKPTVVLDVRQKTLSMVLGEREAKEYIEKCKYSDARDTNLFHVALKIEASEEVLNEICENPKGIYFKYSEIVDGLKDFNFEEIDRENYLYLSKVLYGSKDLVAAVIPSPKQLEVLEKLNEFNKYPI